jgi:hypothetical protein
MARNPLVTPLFRMAAALLCAALVVVLLGPPRAAAANAKSNVRYVINGRGVVDVVDTWTGMAMTEGVYNYFSFTKENGVIPVRVKDGSFTIAFATRSYLKEQPDATYFVSPDFYYEASPLDVEASLTFPDNLKYVDASVKPTSVDGNTLHWTLPGQQHATIEVKFSLVKPFLAPGEVPPEFRIDPSKLPALEAEDIPKSADEVLYEMQIILTAAKNSKATDPDFVKVLEKTLKKFYYLFYVNGLVKDYVLPKELKEGSGETEPKK